VLPFIGGRGDWKKVAQATGGAVATVKPWALQSDGGRGPNAVGTGGAVVRTVRLTGGAQRFQIFSNLSKIGLNLKTKMGVLSYSKNSQFLHAASRQYWEQLAQLCQLQIPNRNKVKNPVTDSVFESLMNFKRDSNLRGKSDKFFQIPS
jgi:hypothetical protein